MLDVDTIPWISSSKTKHQLSEVHGIVEPGWSTFHRVELASHKYLCRLQNGGVGFHLAIGLALRSAITARCNSCPWKVGTFFDLR